MFAKLKKKSIFLLGKILPDRRLHDGVTCIETVACRSPAFHLQVASRVKFVSFQGMNGLWMSQKSEHFYGFLNTK